MRSVRVDRHSSQVGAARKGQRGAVPFNRLHRPPGFSSSVTSWLLIEALSRPSASLSRAAERSSVGCHSRAYSTTNRRVDSTTPRAATPSMSVAQGKARGYLATQVYVHRPRAFSCRNTYITSFRRRLHLKHRSAQGSMATLKTAPAPPKVRPAAMGRFTAAFCGGSAGGARPSSANGRPSRRCAPP